MKTGPRYKIAKRLGSSVFEKTQTQKFAIAMERGARAKSRPRGASEYGKQLLEKQKVRITYGIPERQFRNYVVAATARRGANPVETLHRLLELRLDNVAYRLGLAKTRRGARQMVSHGHVTVNGKKSTVPSQMVRVGDKIAIREGSKASDLFAGFAERLAETSSPSWLSWNPREMAGAVSAFPTAESASPAGDLGMVFSFYSR